MPQGIRSKVSLAVLVACAVPLAAWAGPCIANLGTRQQAVHYGHGVDCSGSWTQALKCDPQDGGVG